MDSQESSPAPQFESINSSALRLPCPSLSPRDSSNSSPLSRWCYLTISFSAIPSPLPSIFPSIRVFSSESALHIKWPEYRSYSFSINPSSEYSQMIFFRVDWFDLLADQGLSRVFSSTTIRKHQFFGAQLSLWSNSHICAWLLEKPQLWLYGLWSAKWCLCFLICSLGLS